jgi:hypothetical protein
MNPAAETGPAGLAGPALTAPDRETHGEKRWTRSRWLVLVILIFAAHVGLLFAFGARKPIVPQAAARVPMLKLANKADEWIALSDPTLFALPHSMDLMPVFRAQTFVVTQPSFRRTEPPGWLPLLVEALGADFNAFMQTNRFAGLELQLKPALKLNTPALPLDPLLPQASTLQIEDGLAQRPLLNALDLPSWPYADVLAPSIVQAVVDAAGNVVSLVLLPPGSGWDDADRRALALARTARFAPAPRLTIGRLIFHWHTVPPPATNAPAKPNEPGP